MIGVQEVPERPGDDDQSMAHIAEAIKNQTADLAWICQAAPQVQFDLQLEGEMHKKTPSFPRVPFVFHLGEEHLLLACPRPR